MREHNRRLYRLALSIVGEAGAAEDVLQDAYVRAFNHLHEFLGGSNPGPWLARIVRNQAIDHLRARRSRQAVLAFESELYRADEEAPFPLEVESESARDVGPDTRLSHEQLKETIEAAIARLPARFRAVFMMREVEGLSMQQTALYLGVPIATVKTRDYRARQLLRKTLTLAPEVTLADAFDFGRDRCDRLVFNVLARLAMT